MKKQWETIVGENFELLAVAGLILVCVISYNMYPSSTIADVLKVLTGCAGAMLRTKENKQ